MVCWSMQGERADWGRNLHSCLSAPFMLSLSALWRIVIRLFCLEKPPRRGLLDQAQVQTPYSPPLLGLFV